MNIALHIFHFGLLVAALVASLLLTGIARRVAPAVGLVDRPGGRKKHHRATPLMGGVAVWLSVLAVVAAAQALDFQDGFLTWLVISGSLYCLVGLVDDKWTLRARTKFCLQILAALPFLCGTYQFDSLQLFGQSLPLGSIAPLVALFWVVACANVVNLLDGVDGLASSIGAIAATSIYALAVLSGKSDVALLSIVLVGSLLGFLYHNRPPARIFLGDAGSLTIGFLVGALSLKATTTQDHSWMLVLPAVVMSIPAFDTAMAILRRKLEGRGIGEPDRGHIHHRLLEAGYSTAGTVAVIGVFCAVMGGASVAGAVTDSDTATFGLCVATLAFVVASGIFGRHETGLLASHVRVFLKGLVTARYQMEAGIQLARLDVKRAEPMDYWRLACERAEQVGVIRLDLGLGVDTATYSWRAPDGDAENPSWNMQAQLETESGEPLELAISASRILGAPEMQLFLEVAGALSRADSDGPRSIKLAAPEKAVVSEERKAA